MSASIAVALNSPPTSRVNGRAGMLANRLLESVKDGNSLTDPEPWSLLEEVLGIVATAEKRIAEQRNRIETLESDGHDRSTDRARKPPGVRDAPRPHSRGSTATR